MRGFVGGEDAVFEAGGRSCAGFGAIGAGEEQAGTQHGVFGADGLISGLFFLAGEILIGKKEAVRGHVDETRAALAIENFFERGVAGVRRDLPARGAEKFADRVDFDLRGGERRKRAAVCFARAR